ncbi:acyltransferase [Sphingomonas sp.]|uniref:acyltransferase family protein n=1 Tax=Sphingomonas sp. TaxID=28214 RepID=UPI0025E07A74|nr:acyltransferase [Sphingomonas sp.]
MFGIWRTLLAIEVVAQHLLAVPLIGFYAVFSFFVLSGFLMTEIVHRTYGYNFRGFIRYLTNRALRLYPSYWFAVLTSLCLIFWLGAATVAHYNVAMTVPNTVSSWLQNLTMIFADLIPKRIVPRLVPLSWALTVEICYYVLIGLGISKTRMTAWTWVALSLAYVLVIRRLHPEGGGYLYEAIPAGSLPFSIGAVTWHYREGVWQFLDRARLGDPRLLIAGRWILYLTIIGLQGISGWKWLALFGNWLNIGISALIICALFHAKATASWGRVDQAIGNYSYPIYLLHLQAGLIAGTLLASSQPTIALFLLAIAVTLVLGSIPVRIIDPIIGRLRTRVRSR